MNKYIFILIFASVAGAFAPTFMERFLEKHTIVETPRKSKIVKKTSTNRSYRSGTATIKADNRGHFIVTARMNGKSFKVLVDTGATQVAINESTARKMGIRLNKKDFKYKVNTANGVAYAASSIIDEIKIDRITVYDVQATILRDKALSGTLLGMSFLNKLDKFIIEDQTLTLKK